MSTIKFVIFAQLINKYASMATKIICVKLQFFYCYLPEIVVGPHRKSPKKYVFLCVIIIT